MQEVGSFVGSTTNMHNRRAFGIKMCTTRSTIGTRRLRAQILESYETSTNVKVVLLMSCLFFSKLMEYISDQFEYLYNIFNKHFDKQSMISNIKTVQKMGALTSLTTA